MGGRITAAATTAQRSRLPAAHLDPLGGVSQQQEGDQQMKEHRRDDPPRAARGGR
jgi:hypothetical protein